MKQKLYTAGLINLIIILTGAIFKVNHFPGAGILLTLGIIIFIALFVPLALISSYRHSGNSNNRILYIIAGITCFVVFAAMLFKIMGWPYAGLAMTIAIPFPYVVFLPVFLVVTSRNDHFSVYKTVFVLFLLAMSSVFNAFLSLNVTRYKIEDSYNVSGSINNVKLSLLELQVAQPQSAVARKIDEVLVIIDQYQLAILETDGLTEERWNDNPDCILRPDARHVVQLAIQNDAELYRGAKLATALNSLIETARSTPGYKDLAEAIPHFAGLPSDAGKGHDHLYFTEDYLLWSLVYLDSLETNLRLLRATGI